MEWTREKTLILIEEYRNRRGLWDMSHEDYRKKDAKKELLEDISRIFNKSVPAIEIEKKFHTLRTQYHREINRTNQSKGDEPYKSKWFAFKHLQFLSSPKACRNGKTNGPRFCIKKVKSEEGIDKPQQSQQPTQQQQPDTMFDESLRKHVVCGVETSNNESSFIITEIKNPIQNHVQVQVSSVQHLPPKRDIIPIPQVQASESMYEDVEEFEESSSPVTTNTLENHCTPLKEELIYAKQIVRSSTISDQQSKRDKSNSVYEEIIYDEDHQIASSTQKKCVQDAVIHQPPQQQQQLHPQPITTQTLLRDENSVYGEYIANELRFITSRDILVTVKHKINTALYEATMAQIQKSG